jgi:N-acetylneuraminate lyase
MSIQGIFPAVLTPFSRNGSVERDLFAAHVERLYKAGVDGVFVAGNAGEWYAATIEERKLLAELAVELSRGRGKTLVHVGALRIEDTRELARHAERIGADAIACLPPYVQPWTLDEVRYWFEQASGACGLPFFIYYFPRLTGGTSGEAFFSAMRTLPRITGYKFTDLNLFDLGVVLKTGATVLNGHDPNLRAALDMGAAGGIGSFYNVAADTVVRIFRGSGAAVAAEQQHLNDLIGVVRGYRLIPALKFISRLQGFPLGDMRDPCLALSAEEQRGLAAKLELLSSSGRGDTQPRPPARP